MTVPTSDNEYLREARETRQHELELARVAADKELKLETQRRQFRVDRRPFIAGILAMFLGAICIVALTIGLIWNAQDTRRQKEHDQQHQAEIAKACIQAGNIWTGGDCLITRKAG